MQTYLAITCALTVIFILRFFIVQAPIQAIEVISAFTITKFFTQLQAMMAVY